MHSDVAISVQNLTKTYRIFTHPVDRIKQALTLGSMRFHRSFTALEDVSFEIKKGEAIGIVGRNGSGKSTLLQLICGILKPTAGEVRVNGRISALLELGSGFNPEFTGRENVYFQGAIMGISRNEMDARFENIATYADIGEFIEQPVRTYSSGMFVRLAFAVIANVDADILVIDEALAVGDVFFQQKCMRHLRKFQSNGGTILFVSHDTAAVTGLCEKAVLLPHGGKTALILGTAKEVCQVYVRQLYSERSPICRTEPRKGGTVDTEKKQEVRPSAYLRGGELPANTIQLTRFRPDAESFGFGSIQIVDVWFEDSTKTKVLTVDGGAAVNLCIKAQALADIRWPAVGFTIKNYLGQYVFSEGTDLAFREHAPVIHNGDTWLVNFAFLMPILIEGDYSINVAVAEGVGDDHIQHHWIEDSITLHSMKSRLTQGICGVQDLSIGIEVFHVDEVVQP